MRFSIEERRVSYVGRMKAWAELLEAVADESHSGRTLLEQAARFRVDLERLYILRKKARKRGLDVFMEAPGPDAGNLPIDRKLAAMGRCKCGLLNPCNNCVGSIYAFASIRRGE